MDIQELVRAGEGTTVEFKRELPRRDNALSTIVAFANTAGGELVIGVDDNDGTIVGVEPRAAREYEQKLGSWAVQLIQPAVVPIVKTYRIDNRLVGDFCCRIPGISIRLYRSFEINALSWYAIQRQNKTMFLCETFSSRLRLDRASEDLRGGENGSL